MTTSINTLTSSLTTMQAQASPVLATKVDFIAQINAIDPRSTTAAADLAAINAQKTSWESDPNSSFGQLSAASLAGQASLLPAISENPALAGSTANQMGALSTALNSPAVSVTAAIEAKQTAITDFEKQYTASASQPISSSPNTAAGSTAPPAQPTSPPIANNALTNAADGDRSNPVAPAKGPTSSTATTGQSGASAGGPDRRQWNPLAKFSSYTYNIALYMLTPDALNAFNMSGRKSIPKTGSRYICQSGGIDNSSSPKRAVGFEQDYYIDDLKIVGFPSAKTTGTHSVLSEMSFTITEPMGFSFITKLKRASEAIKQESGMGDYKAKLSDSMKQFFVLSLGFKGYDVNGNVIDNTKLDIADRYFEIAITEMKFKIDGKATFYHIKAVPVPTIAGFGMKHGRLPHDVTVKATTVEEAIGGLGADGMGITRKDIQGLFPDLNVHEQKLKIYRDGKPPAIKHPNVYKVEYRGPGGEQIKASKLTSPAIVDKRVRPMAETKKTIESNEAMSKTAELDITKRILTFKTDSSIMQCIELIIKESSYLEEALEIIKKNQERPNDVGISPDQLYNGGKILSWYNLSCEVKIIEWDPVTNDWAYEFTYVIQLSKVPSVRAPEIDKRFSPYYGPHKRYDFWLTGINSEILKYEQVLDSAYYNTFLGDAQYVDRSPIASSPQKKADSNTQGGLGSAGDQGRNSVVTQLIDPGHQAEARIQILGDPDLLFRDQPGPADDPFYQDTYIINPNACEVFLEINFREAIDYNNKTGILDINDNIVMWSYPPGTPTKDHGLCYRFIKVVSTFSKGGFVQDINAVISTYPGYKAAQDAREASAEKEREGRRTTPSDPVADTGWPPVPASASNPTSAASADDDATNTAQQSYRQLELQDQGSGRGT